MTAEIFTGFNQKNLLHGDHSYDEQGLVKESRGDFGVSLFVNDVSRQLESVLLSSKTFIANFWVNLLLHPLALAVGHFLRLYLENGPFKSPSFHAQNNVGYSP
ncbi:hypothetical protein AgCh_021485 [Apium graveolens]